QRGLGKIDGARQEMRGSVHYQGYARRTEGSHVRPAWELDAAYRFIAAQMQVRRITAQPPFGRGRKPGPGLLPDSVDIGRLAAGRGDGDIAVALRFFIGLAGPDAAKDIVGL